MDIMASLILYGFIAFVIGSVGKLIYEVQQNKKKEKEADELCKLEAEFELKDKFQTLAGIKGGPTRSLSIDELKKEFENTQFPAPDPSIPVVTAKLTTIGGNYGDSDPLATIPMSRISKEGKKKMAEIAKEDINNQLEQNAEKLSAIFPEVIHEVDLGVSEPKPKKKRNPKQMDGVKSEEPFVKTRKKATKKTK
jgi:hypothetical protein